MVTERFKVFIKKSEFSVQVSQKWGTPPPWKKRGNGFPRQLKHWSQHCLRSAHSLSTLDVLTASNLSVSSSYVMSSVSIWLKAFIRSINNSILASSSYTTSHNTTHCLLSAQM